jgi:hypothetical protein
MRLSGAPQGAPDFCRESSTDQEGDNGEAGSNAGDSCHDPAAMAPGSIDACGAARGDQRGIEFG